MPDFLKKTSSAFLMVFGRFCSGIVPYRKWDAEYESLVPFFLPFSGLLIGLLWYLSAVISYYFSLPFVIGTAIVMLAPFAVTGFRHLCDFTELCGNLPRRLNGEGKARVSSSGQPAGMVYLAVIFVIWYSSVAAILQQSYDLRVLIPIPVLIRAGVSCAFAAYRPDAWRGRKGRMISAVLPSVMAAASAVLTVFFAGQAGLIAVFAAAAAFLPATFLPYRRLGRFTCKAAGFAIVLAETAAVAVLAVF